MIAGITAPSGLAAFWRAITSCSRANAARISPNPISAAAMLCSTDRALSVLAAVQTQHAAQALGKCPQHSRPCALEQLGDRLCGGSQVILRGGEEGQR
jgi:hypothetical protein